MSSTLWRSTDGGRSWQAVALDINAFEYDAESGLLWEVRGTDLLLSRDLGTTWQAMAQLPLRQGPYGLIDWVTDLVAPAGLAGTFYVSTHFDLLRTRDDGRTWETLLPGGDLLLIPAPGAPRTVFGLSHEGLFRLRMPE